MNIRVIEYIFLDFNHGNTSRRLSLNKDIKSERFSDKTRKSNITSNANKKLKEGKQSYLK